MMKLGADEYRNYTYIFFITNLLINKKTNHETQTR